MADTPEWKKTLRESNALGWIALIAVAAVIGISTMVSEKGPEKSHHPADTHPAAQTNPVK